MGERDGEESWLAGYALVESIGLMVGISKLNEVLRTNRGREAALQALRTDDVGGAGTTVVRM